MCFFFNSYHYHFFQDVIRYRMVPYLLLINILHVLVVTPRDRMSVKEDAMTTLTALAGH